MASEITFTFKVSANANGTLVTNAAYTKTQNMPATDQYAVHSVQVVSSAANATAPTVLNWGSVPVTDANGYVVLLRNMSATSIVKVAAIVENSAAPYTTWPIGIMMPGEPFGPVRATAIAAVSGNNLGGLALYPTTSSANVDVEVIVCTGGTPAA